MKTHLRNCATLAASCVAMAITTSAFALHQPDHKSGEAWKVRLLAEAPNGTGATNSDIAFWGNKAYVGNYDGFRIFDISGTTPTLISDFRCFGPQNDLTVYDRDGDGEADLLIASVDQTLTGPECGSVAAAHDDPSGWEGLRIFDISDPAAPVMITSVYQDCGSHTHTLLPQPERGRLLVLNASYPLRPGPTCGPVRGPEAGRDPLHGVIQVVEVPLGNPETAFELTELPINYVGDPDNLFDPSERGLMGFNNLRACHDIAVFQPLGLVAGACAEQAQMWKINPITGLPDTANPLWVYQDKVDTDGPGGGDVAVDFWHSATFSWDGKTVVFIDESFGTGCPTQTVFNGQLSDTGRMFFLDAATGEKLSHYFSERAAPSDDPAQYCSAHLGNTIPMSGRNLLVNAWYTGGVSVVDFTNPRKPREIAFSDAVGDNWSAYWYEFGTGNANGPMRLYATHGVAAGEPRRGFQVFEAQIGTKRRQLPWLNPQTQEMLVK